jgi:Fic family protein
MMVNENKIFTNILYQKTFQVSDRTASHDLKALVDKNQIHSDGKYRGTKYMAL